MFDLGLSIQGVVLIGGFSQVPEPWETMVPGLLMLCYVARVLVLSWQPRSLWERTERKGH